MARARVRPGRARRALHYPGQPNGRQEGMIMGVAISLRPQGWKALVCGVAIAGAALAGSPAGAAPTVPGAPTITGATSGAAQCDGHVFGAGQRRRRADHRLPGRLLVERRWREQVDDRARVADHRPRPHGGQDVHVQRHGAEQGGLRPALGAVGAGRDAVSSSDADGPGCTDDHVGRRGGEDCHGHVLAAGE